MITHTSASATAAAQFARTSSTSDARAAAASVALAATISQRCSTRSVPCRGMASRRNAPARRARPQCSAVPGDVIEARSAAALAGAGRGGRRRTERLDLRLVDISPSALELAHRTLATLPNVNVVTYADTYEAGLVQASAETVSGRALVLFLGSNIGNFDRPGAEEFLRGVRAGLRRGDALLMGADLVKPEPQLLLAYDDPLGVTAAFNRNLLVRINRELGGNFDVGQFDHRAVWAPEASRVEMHLVSRIAQRVRIRTGQPATADVGCRYDVRQRQVDLDRARKCGPTAGRQPRQTGFRLLRRWIGGEADSHDARGSSVTA